MKVIRVINADELITEIEKWKENSKKGSGRRLAFEEVIRETERRAKNLEPSINFHIKGVQARNENLEAFYSEILPVIAELVKEGKTAYAITNILNESGRKTVRGKSFQHVIIGRLIKLAKERGLCSTGDNNETE